MIGRATANYGKNNLTFASPCHDYYKRWMEEMELILSDFTGRPRNVKAISQPILGNKHGKKVYTNILELVLRNANIPIDYSEMGSKFKKENPLKKAAVYNG